MRPRRIPQTVIVASGFALLAGAMLGLDDFRRDAVLIALSFAICAGAFDYASGYAGLRSLGPIVPFGLASYAHAIIKSSGVPFAGSLLIVPLAVSALGALLCGMLVGRRRDIASWTVFGLAISIALEQVARAATSLTGGSNGILVSRYFGGGQMGVEFAAFVLVVSFVLLACLLRAVDGQRGARVLLAHFEPDRLEAHGISLALTRIRASALQWYVAAVGGVFFAAVSGAIDPSVFGVQNNLIILVACVLFGERTIIGPACAAFIIVLSENVLGSIWAGWQTLLLGLFLMVALLWRNHDWGSLRGGLLWQAR